MQPGLKQLLLIGAFFLSFSSLAQNLLIAPWLGNTSESNFDARLVAVSVDQNRIIFTSKSSAIPGYSGEVNNNNLDLVYIKNVQTGVVEQLFQTEEGIPVTQILVEKFSDITADNSFYFYYYGTDPLIGYIAPENPDQVLSNYYRIDLDTRLIYNVATPDTNRQVQHLLTSHNGTLYLVASNKLYVSEDLGDSWQLIEEDCTSALTVGNTTHNNGLVYRCYGFIQDINTFKVYDPGTQSTTTVGPRYVDGSLYNFNPDSRFANGFQITKDASKIIYGRDDFIYLHSVGSDTTKSIDLFDFRLQSPAVFASDNTGTKILFIAQLKHKINAEAGQQNLTDGERGLFLYDANANGSVFRIDITQASTDGNNTAIPLENLVDVVTDNAFDSIFLNSEVQEEDSDDSVRNTYHITTDAIVSHQYNNTNDELAIALAQQDSHYNLFDISHAQLSGFYQLHRTNKNTGQLDVFWLQGQQFEDYQLGLQPGENDYRLYPCNFNLQCDFSLSATVTVDTQDFEQDEQWQISIVDRYANNDDRTQWEVLFEDFNWPEADKIKIRSLNSALQQTFSVENTISMSLEGTTYTKTYAVQPCVNDQRNDYPIVCSTFVSKKDITGPVRPNFQLLMATDYSYVSIYFEQTNEMSYQIERSIPYSHEYELLARNISSGWQDTTAQAGESYSYRLTGCDASGEICFKQDQFRYEIAQKADLNVRVENGTLSGGAFLLEISNAYDVDELTLLRRTKREDFTEIATLSPQTRFFIDNDILPGMNHYYKIISKRNGSAHQEYEQLYPRRASESNINDTLYPNRVNDIDVDSESYFYGIKLSWEPVPNAISYYVNIIDIETGRSFYTAESPNEPSYYFDLSKIGRPFNNQLFNIDPISFSVTPEFNDCNSFNYSERCKIYRGKGAFTGPIPISRNLTATRLHPITLETSQESPMGIQLSWENSNLMDYYVISRRASDSETWELLHSKKKISNIYDPKQIFLDSSRYLAAGKQYFYKLRSCSALTGSCSEFETATPVLFRNQLPAGKPVTPEVEINAENFVVDFGEFSPSLISFVQLRARWEDNQQEYWIFDELSQVETLNRPNIWSAGTFISFDIRYCFNDRNDSHEAENCTEYSDSTTIEIPILVKPPKINVDLESPVIGNGEAIINGTFSTTSYYDAPQTIELYRATNNEAPQKIQSIDQPQQEESENSTPFTFTDSSLMSENYYHYIVVGCNESGCHSDTTRTIIYRQVTTTPPTVPVINSIIASQYSLRITFPRIELNDYRILRASSENGEFLELAVLSSGSQYTDSNLEPDTIYFYKIQTCNDIGCSESEVMAGHTTSLFYEGPISLTSAEILQRLDSVDTGGLSFDGDSAARNGVPVAYQGSIKVKRWLKIDTGFELTISASPRSYKSAYAQIIEINLRLSNAEEGLYNSYFATLGCVIYTGGRTTSDCYTGGELDAESFYLISDFFKKPVKLNIDTETALTNWLEYSFKINAERQLTLSVDNELVAVSDAPFPADIFGTSQLSMNLNAMNNVQIIADTPDTTSMEYLLTSYNVNIRRVHVTKAALISDSLANRTDLQLQVRNKINGNFIESVNSPIFTGGQYNAIINGLQPGTRNDFILRLCDVSVCGPWFYDAVATEPYKDIPFRPAFGSYLVSDPIDGAMSMHIDLSAGPLYVIDDYIVYKTTDENEEKGEVMFRLLVDDMLEHLLLSDSDLVTVDPVLPGQYVKYSLEVCNVVGCLAPGGGSDKQVPEDSDGDGFADPFDDFPNDPNESKDTDNDGIGNNQDTDDDGDGIPDDVEIEAGMDPLDENDVYQDLDGDGFNNLFEYRAGSEINNIEHTPEQSSSGIYTSFETPSEEYIAYSNNGRRVESSGYDNHSIQATFDEAGQPDLVFTVTGKLNKGYVVFSESFTSRPNPIKFFVNGEAIDLSEARFEYIEFWNNNWHTIAFSVEATEDVATIGIAFNGYDTFPFSINIDRLFIPLTSAEPMNKRATLADFDGDGKTDIATRNGALGRNYAINSSDSAIQRMDFGSQADDIQVAGDFDGDAKTDFAVRRPSNHTWYVKNSSGSNYNSEREDGIQRVIFGKQADDIPVPADYDGDGITDFAVRRASNNTWYIKNSSGSNYNSSEEDSIQRVRFGLQEADIPVPADYDGDGKADIAFRRPANSTWYILESTTGEIRRVRFGLQATDIPVPADYDGDGKTDIAVRRANDRMWYILQSSDNSIQRVKFGLQESDIPVVGDYDGDGKADIAVRRNSNAMWYVLNSSDNEIQRIEFGKRPELIPLLTPIWEKLTRLGWNNDFLFSATPDGSDFTQEEEQDLLEQTDYLVHPEYQGSEQVMSEDTW